MGTPEFAVPSLTRLFEAGYEIAAVVTAPDKPAGRGMQLTESAIKIYAKSKNLKILQPEKLKNPEFLEELKLIGADLQVVVAFRMLPESVWNLPPLGTINLHSSLLPQYRGAAPINWVVINGERETGLTTFKLQHEIDTGDILLQKKIKIGDDESAGSLHDRMMEEGAGLLLNTVNQLTDGSLKETPQASGIALTGALRYAPKIFTETCEIKWDNSCKTIFNMIRGLSPYPAAFTFLNGKKLKIYKGEIEYTGILKEPGNMETDRKTFMKFSCNDGFISLKEIQLEGKKRMAIADFLRGWRES